MAQIRVAVACHNASGQPDMVLVSLEASEASIEVGDHYQMARERAQLMGYEKPMVCYDSADFPAITAMASQLTALEPPRKQLA